LGKWNVTGPKVELKYTTQKENEKQDDVRQTPQTVLWKNAWITNGMMSARERIRT